MTIKVKFVWYDIWVGVYIDKPKKRVYIILIPTLPIILDFNTELPKKQELAQWAQELKDNGNGWPQNEYIDPR